MGELRLGDEIDDFCAKCKRLTNHAVVSIVNGEAAKVRCRSCYHEHNYLREQIPPSKKDLKKAELFGQVLGNITGDGKSADAEEVESAEVEAAVAPVEPEPVEAPAPAPAKKTRGKAKKA